LLAEGEYLFDHSDDEQEQQAQICFMGQTEKNEAHVTEEGAEKVGKVSIFDLNNISNKCLTWWTGLNQK